MADNATSNRTALRFITEAVFGTTPATPALQDLRYTGESLDYAITTTQSKEIRADRNVANTIPTKAGSSGDVQFELSAQSFDLLIQAALCGTWATDVLKNGTTNRSFTIQKHFQDMVPAVYNNLRGLRVGSFELDFKPGAILTGKFAFLGTTSEMVTPQITGATIVPATTTTPMNGVSNVQNIEEDGVASTMAYKSITLMLDNSLRQQEAIGSLAAIGIVPGTCNVTGSFEAYFSSLTMYNRYVNNEAFALGFDTIDDEGNAYSVLLPAVKIETAKVLSGGGDQDVVASCTYRAIYDATEACMIKITRTVIP